MGSSRYKRQPMKGSNISDLELLLQKTTDNRQQLPDWEVSVTNDNGHKEVTHLNGNLPLQKTTDERQ